MISGFPTILKETNESGFLFSCNCGKLKALFITQPANPDYSKVMGIFFAVHDIAKNDDVFEEGIIKIRNLIEELRKLGWQIYPTHQITGSFIQFEKFVKNIDLTNIWDKKISQNKKQNT